MSLKDAAEQVRENLEAARRPKPKADFTPTGVTISDAIIEGHPAENWDKVLGLFNLDPEHYEVADDTVRFATWEQSARTRDGGRDRVQLYSVRAFFRRKVTATKVDVTELLRQLRGARRPAARKTTTNRTRVVIVSDAQVGKVDERGGTEELLARIDYLLGELENECRLVKCDDAVILDPGDLLEGFENTGSQAFTNDLSLPEQLKVARGILTETILRVSRLHPEGTRVATVPSNHSAWRKGKSYLGKPGDDFGLDCHAAVSEAFKLAGRDDVTFTIPEPWDESLAITVRGAVVGLVHGHQVSPGKLPEWWAKQSHGSGPTARANILVSGHYHHLTVQPSGALDGKDRWWIQAPTLDNGSAWFRNIAGTSGEPGLLTFTINDAGDWDNLRLLRHENTDFAAV